MPWLETPFCNEAIRDRVVAAAESQVSSAESSQEFGDPQGMPSRDIAKMEVLLFNEDFTTHGYDYYFKLLALRKAWGLVAASVLTKNLGRSPTKDEFLAEVQGRVGPRGFLLAEKGLKNANAPSRLNDEELVVMAVLTAIMGGTEVFIVTRDPAVFEQYFKILCLMKEHYRAMLVADKYAANPDAMPFREVLLENDNVHIRAFSGSSVLQFETTDVEFNPLPPSYHFVDIHCLLLEGGPAKLRVTFSSFRAEAEMAEMLKVKAITDGLSTDKFDGRNCTIRTAPLRAENHKIIVSIGKEATIQFGSLGSFGSDDFNNTLFENEEHTNLFLP
jgi:hypothetical protein